MLEMGLDTFGDISADGLGRPLSHAQVIRNIAAEAVLADSLGVHVFGIGEHHRADFAVSSPEVLLGVIAGRTDRIRLCSAVTVLSSDDPVRVFQRFATLQAATDGRAEIIVGRGAYTESFPLFGYELSQYGALFEEKLDLLSALLHQEAVTWTGKLRPALHQQRIYPPLEKKGLTTWVAVGSTPQSALRAAEHRLPLMLGIIGGEPQRFKPFAQSYRETLERLGGPVLPIGVHSPGYVADTDSQARDEYWSAYQPWRDQLGTERGWPPITRAKFDVEVERGSLYVGSPESVSRRISETVLALGASRFHLKYSTGALAHEKLMRCIELYGREVIPRVQTLLHLHDRKR